MKKKRGFTLVELLVVISIIAVLLAILMPSLNAAKQQASAVVCLFNVRTLSTAWHMYAGENRDKIVGAHTTLSGPDSLAAKVNHIIPDMSAVYSDSKSNFATNWVELPQTEEGARKDNMPLKDQEIIGIKRGLLFTYVGKKIEVYHCPSDKRLIENKKAGYGGYRSYSIAGGMDGWFTRPATKVVKKYSQIPQPSQKYVFVEEKWIGSPGWNGQAWQLYPTGDEWIDPVSVSHRDKSILGFADGHGEAIKWKDKRTILFSNSDRGAVPALQPDNPDLKYMQERWTTPK